MSTRRRSNRRCSPLPPLLVALTLAASACAGMPRDPEGTLRQVTSGTLSVGVIHSPPWARVDGEAVSGLEADMVRALARRLDAEVEWRPGGDQELMEALERFELDLVVGGLAHSNPWKKRVALTRPYLELAEGKRVWAVPPGENAWLVYVESFLRGDPYPPDRRGAERRSE